LLEAIVSDATCPRAIDDVMHAVSWGDPDILRSKLQTSLGELTGSQLARAMQHALVCAMHSRTPRQLRCVSILLDTGAPLTDLSFNALCADELAKYSPAPLHELERKLLVRVPAAEAPCAPHSHTRRRTSVCMHGHRSPHAHAAVHSPPATAYTYTRTPPAVRWPCSAAVRSPHDTASPTIRLPPRYGCPLYGYPRDGLPTILPSHYTAAHDGSLRCCSLRCCSLRCCSLRYCSPRYCSLQ
jgi:hypothetical protein